MASSTNYPSCIKIPNGNTEQNRTSPMGAEEVNNAKEAMANYKRLILFANQVFGEEKWSHSITNQTLDFVESSVGKYVCGCATFVKIQLHDGPFHEDMGYHSTEATTKGRAIHIARTQSMVNAFSNVLMCFGNAQAEKLRRLSNKMHNKPEHDNRKQDSQSIIAMLDDSFDQVSQLTPNISHKNKATENKVPMLRSKSPTEPKEQTNSSIASMRKNLDQPKTNIPRAKSPVEQIAKPVQQFNDQSTKIKNESVSLKTNPQSTSVDCKENEPNNVQKNQQQPKVLTEEELQRIERKRKQMEKQAAYKKLMKEKEENKLKDDKKANPKY